jgi:hypothetical protein
MERKTPLKLLNYSFICAIKTNEITPVLAVDWLIKWQAEAS